MRARRALARGCGQRRRLVALRPRLQRLRKGLRWLRLRQLRLRALLRSCQNRSRVIYHIFNSHSRDRLERYVFSSTDDLFFRYVADQAQEMALPRERLQSIADFCRYASIGFFLRTVWNHLRYNVDEVVDDLDRYIRCFVRAALDDGSIVRDGSA